MKYGCMFWLVVLGFIVWRLMGAEIDLLDLVTAFVFGALSAFLFDEFENGAEI